MHDLTGFQRDLLYVVAGADGDHGLAIRDELEQYYDDDVHHGRLYPNLDELAAVGLVAKRDDGQRENEYAITRRGRRELRARREWERQHLDED